jgi:nucleoside-diphosphate-sugar epimerase
MGEAMMAGGAGGARPGAGGREVVLVTGAAGFLGSHVVELLSAAGRYEVVAADIAGPERSRQLAGLPGVEFRQVDLRDRRAAAAAVAGCQVVVHLAAVLRKTAAARPREALEVNVGVTYDLVSAAAAAGVRRFVYGSSQAVYGSFQDAGAPYFAEDQAAVRPGLSMYGASKLAAEALIEAVAGAGGPACLALRLGTIYGPRVSRDSNNGILIEVLEALDRGDRPVVPWARDALHALIFAADAARAVVRAVQASQGGMAVNVVGDPVSSEMLYTTLVKLYGADPSLIDWQDRRTRYQRVRRDQMRSVLGLEPQTSLEDGLRAVIAWHRTQVG